MKITCHFTISTSIIWQHFPLSTACYNGNRVPEIQCSRRINDSHFENTCPCFTSVFISYECQRMLRHSSRSGRTLSRCNVLFWYSLLNNPGSIINILDLQSFIFQYAYHVHCDQSWRILTWWSLLENLEKGFTISWPSVLSSETLSPAGNLNNLFKKTSGFFTVFQGTVFPYTVILTTWSIPCCRISNMLS